MALTLPYPSMNFVPLDVLTAAEQNQLVANIEYIANQFPITNANIASSAVKSQNIDWTTMQFYEKRLHQAETLTQTSNYQYLEITGLKAEIPTVVGATYMLFYEAYWFSTYVSGNVEVYFFPRIDNQGGYTGSALGGLPQNHCSGMVYFTAIGITAGSLSLRRRNEG